MYKNDGVCNSIMREQEVVNNQQIDKRCCNDNIGNIRRGTVEAHDNGDLR